MKLKKFYPGIGLVFLLAGCNLIHFPSFPFSQTSSSDSQQEPQVSSESLTSQGTTPSSGTTTSSSKTSSSSTTTSSSKTTSSSTTTSSGKTSSSSGTTTTSSTTTSSGGGSDVDKYYSSVSGNKNTLLESVNTTICDGAIDIGYAGLWTAYNTTDIRDDGYIYDVYSNMTKFKPGDDKCGSYSDIGDCYNREHSIPKSWWGGAESKQGSDLYIVIPSDGKVNGMRSNYPYGEVTGGTSYKLPGDPEGNKLGTSSDSKIVSGTVFEPFDDRKGDLARIVFYAVARYLKTGASKGAVKNWTGGEGGSVFGDGSSCTNYIKTSYLSLLLKWHKQDPVSTWEINRNAKGQSIQKNRNPFVDHPSWVDIIWGGTYGADQMNGEDTNGGNATVDGGHIQ